MVDADQREVGLFHTVDPEATGTTFPAEDNALFVERCVNHHQALVDALTSLIEWVGGGDEYADVVLAKRRAIGRAVLALAESRVRGKVEK